MPEPTGRLLPTASGVDLILTRTFAAPIGDVWDSLTHPDRTAGWIGTWNGDPGPGHVVTLQMAFEEGTPSSVLTIERCRPPAHLAVAFSDAGGGWRLEVKLAESESAETGTATVLTFIHHLTDPAGVGDIGPGWEYYLDMLVAARADTPLPAFADYHPAQSSHFTDQLPV